MLQQISVFVRDRVGAILDVTRALKEGGFNIRAFSAYDTPEFSVLRLVMDESEAVAQYLARHDFFVFANPVVGVKLEDRPGDLNDILERVAEAGLQIHYMYSLVLQSDGSVLMLIHSDDDERLEALLRAAGRELA